MREVSSGFEALSKIFAGLDLGFAERVLSEAYRPEGSVGRPHRSLLGMFKAELAKRLGGVRSYRALCRLLEVDGALRSLCEIKTGEKPYDRSTLTRFRRRVGPERLERIMSRLVRQLDKMSVLDCGVLALDATFIEAYSRRDPEDNSRGLFDSEARLRRQGRNVVLGYGVHLAVDTKSEMPLAAIVEPASANEKKIAIPLLRKVRKRRRRLRSIVADSQYSSEGFRCEIKRLGAEPVIPYPRNQRRGEKGVLRVDKKFRSHGPWRLKRLYRCRSAIERVVARLVDHFGLEQVRIRGRRNVLTHTFLCLIAMLIIAVSACLLGHPNLMRSPVRLMNLTGRI